MIDLGNPGNPYSSGPFASFPPGRRCQLWWPASPCRSARCQALDATSTVLVSCSIRAVCGGGYTGPESALTSTPDRVPLPATGLILAGRELLAHPVLICESCGQDCARR